jgi:ribosomal protein S12 methylthiotransferase
MISLGCAKNLIDSEIMMGHLQQAGMTLIDEPEKADALIINTCSFIDNAKKESVDTILDAVESRGKGRRKRPQRLIVAGCLSQRFKDELPKLMPQIDAFVGLDQLEQIPEIIRKALDGVEAGERDFVTVKPRYIPDWDTPRLRLTPHHSAYIKIAEGCNHPCSFCIIPKIRGMHRSRTLESVVKEARILVRQGVKELNLISQDTTYFGMDRWEGGRPKPTSGVDSSRGESLAMLLQALNAIEGDFWIRLLYTHPAHWSDELIQTIASCDKVVKYVDMPLQHISDSMLDRMKRETSGDYIRDLVRRMRAGIPGLAIRTTFIVGFPGETDADFEELVQFIEAARFERMGVFQYSREEGTRAFGLGDQVHHMRKKSRWNRAMALQSEVNASFHDEQVGQRLRVLVDAPGIARSFRDAPEVDGVVFVDQSLPVGAFAEVLIEDALGYDLIAENGKVLEIAQ